MQFSTPLRYPGGKAKLTDFLKVLIFQNDLMKCDYFEPYAGGAGVAINLLLHGYAARIHLNDLNRAVFAFWDSVINHTDELCKLISDVTITMDEWYKQKEIQLHPSGASNIELGFSTFFLNRTNRSGILKGGVIGGKAQNGNWKIDARFNKANLVERIERIAIKRDFIFVYNYDAKIFLTDVVNKCIGNAIVYLDPPYYVKGQELYENHYSPKDHEEISKIVDLIKKPWVVSYDYAPEIIDLYKKYRSIVYGINYSAQNRYNGSEVMFFKDGITIPDVENPAKFRAV